MMAAPRARAMLLIVSTVMVYIVAAVPHRLTASAKKGPCTDYFGPVDQDGNLTTVVDPDVMEGFPFATKTFVHHVGPNSVCLSPGPPEGCHRYYIVSYEATKCPSDCPLVDGTGAKLAGKMDTSGLFDRANGMLLSCAACATGASIACWHAPANAPVHCACPGSDW